MTLFKNDYKLLPIYIQHYKNLGITNFTFYYNMTITELMNLNEITEIIDNITNDKTIDVTLIEWPFQYWKHINSNFMHYSQTTAITDMYYKSRYRFKYVYFNDLDEYLFFEDNNIKTIEELINKYFNVDVFQFNMYWSKYINDAIEIDENNNELITYDNLKNNFNSNNFQIQKISDINQKFNRSKILLRTNLMGCTVHKEICKLFSNNGNIKLNYNKIIIDGFYHICNIKEKTRMNFVY